MRVRCFGDLEVSVGGHVIAADAEGRSYFQPLEILALVASRPPTGLSKEQVLTTMWPETTEQRGAKRLSVTLVRLRELLGTHVPDLPAGVARCDRNGMCRLDPAWVWSDVHEFLALVAEGQRVAEQPDRGREAKEMLARAYTLYRGDLLTNPYYEWVHERGDGGLTPREHYRELFRQATFTLAGLHCDDGEDALAVPLYRALLRLEPTLEEATQHLYRCYARLGDRKAIILEDRRLRQALRAELSDPDEPDGLDDLSMYRPTDETMEVYEEVLAELSRRGRESATASQEGELVAAGD